MGFCLDVTLRRVSPGFGLGKCARVMVHFVVDRRVTLVGSFFWSREETTAVPGSIGC